MTTNNIKQQFRAAVLANAIADIGNGEEGENNGGPYVRGLLEGVGVDFSASWCAAAVWSWIEKAIGFERMIGDNPRNYIYLSHLETPSAKLMFNKCREFGWFVDSPEPGDLIFSHRPSNESWHAHVGIVAEVSKHGIQTIEGNKGSYPAKVQRYVYALPIDNLLGYARLLGE